MEFSFLTFFMNGEGDGLETRGGTATEEKQRLAGDSLVDRDTSLPPTPRDRQGTAGPGRPLSSGLGTVSRFFQPSDDYGGITQPLDQPSGKEVLIRSSKGHSLISLPPPATCFLLQTCYLAAPATPIQHPSGPQGPTGSRALCGGYRTPGDWGPALLLSLAV